ncbi:class I SAM-dependent methyltransferase [Saccharomonospora iraqiensis]|uniref:class I SAM-dependent methyltransferase n=1 Tax=Saccharomonospora iraqiensis TaxID=52698 RepID=UPI00022E247B|nr:class I SAM-dependent methyltransferase [Saccharomonospora iraqiensis]
MTTPDIQLFDQRTPDERDRPFLPGMGRAWLLPLYDTVTRLAGVRAVYERTAALAGVAPGESVVDVGCGTGNLTFAVLAATPQARVTGLDPDGDALRRAAHKAHRRRVGLTLVQGYADRIPADDAALDHVISSLALHHADDDGRAGFARDALRALRPGGTVTVADFDSGPTQGATTAAPPAHTHRHGPGHVLRNLLRIVQPRRSRAPVVAHEQGDGLVALLTGAGFTDAREVAHLDHRFGRIAVVRATRPMDTMDSRNGDAVRGHASADREGEETPGHDS